METVSLEHPGRLLFVESLDYKNPYDFTQIHKHDYFEIILVKKGGGSQLIDDQRFELEDLSGFIIQPGQVHLLNRDVAEGKIIQFGKNIFAHLFPLEFHHLLFKQPNIQIRSRFFSFVFFNRAYGQNN